MLRLKLRRHPALTSLKKLPLFRRLNMLMRLELVQAKCLASTMMTKKMRPGVDPEVVAATEAAEEEATEAADPTEAAEVANLRRRTSRSRTTSLPSVIYEPDKTFRVREFCVVSFHTVSLI